MSPWPLRMQIYMDREPTVERRGEGEKERVGILKEGE